MFIHSDLIRIKASRLHSSHTLSRNIVGILAITLDILAIGISIVFSWTSYSYFFSQEFFDPKLVFQHFVILSTFFCGITALKWGYRFTSLIHVDRAARDVFMGWSLSFIVFVMMIFVVKISSDFSRGAVILSYPFGFLFISSTRHVFGKQIILFTKTNIIVPERLLVIGRHDEILRFGKEFQPWNQGFMMADIAQLPEKLSHESIEKYAARIKPRLKEIVKTSRDMAFNTILLALPWSENDVIEMATDELLALPAALHLVPDSILERFNHSLVQRIGSISTLTLARPPLSPVEIMLKRLLDLSLSLLALPFLCVLMGFIALAIKLEGGGAVFFTQKRNGFNQTPFTIYKFRSMTKDKQVTAVGRFIRRWNLDEIPQILNVIKGNMSLVGPRPHDVILDEEQEKRLSLYARRFNIKPGMTGWAQVNGARGAVSNKNSMARRIDYDLWYMDNWSLMLDLRIMIQTVMTKKAFENAF